NTHSAGVVGKHALSRDQFFFWSHAVTPICIVARRFRRGGRGEMSKLFAAIAIAATLVGSAQAPTYPSRPITLVVPFPGGRADRPAGPRARERNEGGPRPTRHRRNPARSGSHHRHRPRRTRGARWLHGHPRPLADARRQRRDLRAPVRRGEGFRADIAG